MQPRIKQLVTVLLLSFALLLSFFALLQEEVLTVHAIAVFPDLITTTVNIETEPPTLDPGESINTTSNQVIEQLFIGLVDVDDRTGDIKPELASSWETSSDRTVYTFTLRNDIFWSDGNPVTAQDVHYSIIRTLDPVTNSDADYLLYAIENAEDFSNGVITDAAQVGVTVINTTSIRFDFTGSLAYESFFASSATRPLPQWVIDVWGDDWTEPNHIVTSGAYRLKEWEHNDHILLEKNASFYNADNVQINRVTMWMTDTQSAGQLYLDGKLDTTNIWNGIPSEVLESDAVKIYSSGCTYYYGFNITKPPFDNVKVRQAFATAINRQGLIDSVLGGQPLPAITFTPPQAFGYVNGYVEGIGWPYNITQARQLLADAGYPNGQGLPSVTLWYNTDSGHQAIAEYVQQDWYSTLGVSVILQSMDYGDYLGEVNDGTFQVWRNGWCMDYPDAYNFLHDGMLSQGDGFGDWSNATYDSLLSQALQSQDSNTRKALYKQAEEILVETDTVMIPVYYYVSSLVTKPYLDRTYPVGTTYDISDWRITVVQEAIDESGGSVTSYDDQTTVNFPQDAFSDTVVVTFSPAYETGLGSDLSGTGNAFELTATYSDTGESLATTAMSFTIVITYGQQAQMMNAQSTNEDNLGLYYKEGNTWILEPSSAVNTVNKTVTAITNKLGLWAVLQKKYSVYLPVVLK